MKHQYAAHLTWNGNLGDGTATYEAYSRSYSVRIEGKPDLLGSSAARYRGEPDKHDPEDLFLASITSCHMLAYLALCARQGINVIAYEDRARATMVTIPDRGGRFETVLLSPVVTIADGSDLDLAEQLHTTAHERCFIANSCSVPIHHAPQVRVVAASTAAG